MKTPPNEYRVRKGPLASNDDFGCNGAFLIPFESYTLCVIAADNGGWDHVSVSLKNRTPNWREMCFIKDLFFNDEDWVTQYHPPKGLNINIHDNCLHMWRPHNEKMPTPPTEFV